MTSLEGIGTAFKVLAAVVAVLVARRRFTDRPVAVFLTTVTLADLARAVLSIVVFDPTRARMVAEGLDPATVPFVGLARVAFHLGEALFLTWPAGLVALSLSVFARRRPWPVAILWALVVAALVVTYPVTRQAVLQRCYLAADLAALMVSLGFLVGWLRRLQPLDVVHVCVSLVMMADLCAAVLGAYNCHVFECWPLAQVCYAALYALMIVLQGGSQWISPSLSRS